MKLKALFFPFILLIGATVCKAQNAIVLDDQTAITIDEDLGGYTMTCTCSYLINNERAQDMLDFIGHFDKEHKLVDFEGVLSANNFERKIKRNDLHRTEYSSELAIDGYTLFTDITPPSYPATIKYTYTIRVDNEMISLPRFVPQNSYDIDVRHSQWTMSYPDNFTYHYAVLGKEIKKNVQKSPKGGSVLTFTLDSIKGVSQEPFSQSLQKRVPMAIVVPDTIIYNGTTGSQRTWKALGEWHDKLAEGRQGLPSDAVVAIKNATDTCKTKIGKIVALKKLMDSRSHYVSIQLGIGGYQPETSSTTWKLGFGDCKGLSNLMKAMLKEVGIDSKLVAINLGSKFLIDDLPTISFMNHMILEVPLGKDTCWLECTSDKVPVGYVHDDIAGHKALAFDSEGGQLVTLPQYADSTELNNINIDVQLKADGKAHMTVIDEGFNSYYEGEVALLSKPKDKLIEAFNDYYNLPQAKVNDVTVSCNTAPFTHPSVTIKGNADGQYSRLMGKRMFVKLNPSAAGSTPNINSSRTEDFYISSGHKVVTTTTIHLPQGFSVESVPKDFSLEEKFGKLSFSIKVEPDKVTATKVMFIRNGTFPKAMCDKMVQFFKTSSSLDNSKLVLVKNQ